MRIFKNLFFLFLMLICVAFLSINSHIIYIRILPSELNLSNDELKLPVYVIMLVFTALGFFLGTLFEYFRTRKDRRSVKKRLREVERLHVKGKYLTTGKTLEADEILRMLK
mgnify:CR=1 FL=1